MIGERYNVSLNGSEIIRLGVAVALLDQFGRLLLEFRSDVSLWGITGGRLDPGETPQQCGCREIFEETGLTLTPDDLSFFNIYGDPSDGRILQYPDNRVHLIDIVYTARVDSSRPLSLSSESLALTYFNSNSLPCKIVPPAVRPINDLVTHRFLL
jgi:8-oxo-dGTP pyrophosphatase MutT (NUDIX family)